eukprot:3108918-Pyramimonas_sp.AAC.1
MPHPTSTRARYDRCVRIRSSQRRFAFAMWASRGKSFGLLKWSFDPRLPRQHAQRAEGQKGCKTLQWGSDPRLSRQH